jgi:DNA-dependent RNA polymerase auxiliary subunit epsilon
MATGTNKKKLYNMIHKHWFHIEFIFALQDTPVDTELENGQVGRKKAL